MQHYSPASAQHFRWESPQILRRGRHVVGPGLTCQPSCQRYKPLGPRAWRPVDKGVCDGFSARLDYDEEDLVAQYEHLFEVS